MSHQDTDPTDPEAATTHRLGPLEFDRADLVYFAACSCGHRIGPLATVTDLQAVFERHRASMGTVDPPSG